MKELTWVGVLLTFMVCVGCERHAPDLPLTVAAEAGDRLRLVRLLEQGMDPDATDGQGWGPLHWAAGSGRSEIIDALVEAGADVDRNDQGRNRWTPLMHAIHTDQEEAATRLLARGASANATSPGGVPPLIMAAGYGQSDLVEVLLHHGADPYADAGNGITALWAAAGGGAIRDFTDGPSFGTCFPETIRILRENAPDLRLTSGLASRLVVWFSYLRGCEETVRGLRAK